MFDRYAIFYTPAAGAFADFGASWLGWDSQRGAACRHPRGTELDLAALTATPRKYGFHATLKAPFRLADGATPEDLHKAVDAFAACHAPIDLGGFELSVTHGFLALRPTNDPGPLRILVASIVQDFDGYRAPLTEADIARRRRSRLTARQDKQMLDWGYPYIFDDFNFHMTLSGSLRKATPDGLVETAGRLLAPVLPERPVLDGITLMGQDAQGMFHQLHRAALSD